MQEIIDRIKLEYISESTRLQGCFYDVGIVNPAEKQYRRVRRTTPDLSSNFDSTKEWKIYVQHHEVGSGFARLLNRFSSIRRFPDNMKARLALEDVRSELPKRFEIVNH